MTMPVIAVVPSSDWGIGPSLLYMFGMIGALIYIYTARTPGERQREADRARREDAMRKEKAEASFHAALEAAAKERSIRRRKA